MLPTPIVKDLDYDKVYEPSEDSFLLLDCFEEERVTLQNRFKNEIPIITEIGTGSGIVTAFLRQNILPQSIFLTTDINPTSCQTVAKTMDVNELANPNLKTLHSFDSLQMSLTTALRDRTIDLLVFNPPYVPAEMVPSIPTSTEDDSWLDLALLGGVDGMVTTWKVLNNLSDILTPKTGIAYILFCARNKPDQVAGIMKSRGWIVESVIHRKAGWEVLSVLLFSMQ